MIVTIVEQALALVGVTLAAALLSRFTRLELALACVICGFMAGQSIRLLGFDTGIQASDLQDLVFFVILPILVFEAAWHIDVQLLKRWLWPILLLSTVGLVISSGVAGGLVYLAMGRPESFPWIAALLTGAIIAATDPVATIQQLRQADAPEDLATLIEGESLLNDATAVVLFSLVLMVALEPDLMEVHGVQLFAGIFVGGACLGLFTGLVATVLLLLLRRPEATTIVLLFTAFGSFFIAEHVLNVSGIMAVMMAALIARGFLKEVEDSIAGGLSHTWEWSSELLKSILFVIMGLMITLGMFETHWLAMIIATVAALVARVAAVAICAALSGVSRRPIPRAWQFVMAWGGERGVIALALALALPMELDYWYVIQSMVFGVVLFGLLIQSTTVGAAIRRLTPERRTARREAGPHRLFEEAEE